MKIEWEVKENILQPYVMDGGKRITVVWAPQPGSQEAFLTCPVHEVLFSGTRGPGKSDALLMDFGQHVGCGLGASWRGVLFRQSFPDLEDVIAKSNRWFPLIWPGVRYNIQQHKWSWPTGETLIFRHILRPADYYSFHGHEYPWIGFEELTNWPDDQCYRLMFSCNRSSNPNAPLKIRSTCNPYGKGHNWVKLRFKLPIQRGRIIGPVLRNNHDDNGVKLPDRVCIQGFLWENKILLHANPNYLSNIITAARNRSEMLAWTEGDWNIIAGGMFDDIWDQKYHVVVDFPLELIPKQWRIDRSYDHGQSKPFSVGWWAESNGEPFEYQGRKYGTVKGDLFRIREWYGWNGQPNEGVRLNSTKIGEGIIDREKQWNINQRVKVGPADSSIFNDEEEETSIAKRMADVGVYWEHADKRPGSRKQGWELIREYLESSIPDGEGYRENPGIFICENCEQFLRTFPVLPRSDKDIDDVDSDGEDHIGDEVRYRVRHSRRELRRGKTK